MIAGPTVICKGLLGWGRQLQGLDDGGTGYRQRKPTDQAHEGTTAVVLSQPPSQVHRRPIQGVASQISHAADGPARAAASMVST